MAKITENQKRLFMNSKPDFKEVFLITTLLEWDEFDSTEDIHDNYEFLARVELKTAKSLVKKEMARYVTIKTPDEFDYRYNQGIILTSYGWDLYFRKVKI